MGSLSIEQILEASVLRNTQPEWALELEFFRINPEYLLEELFIVKNYLLCHLCQAQLQQFLPQIETITVLPLTKATTAK